jgi:hypothetical protein
MKKRKSAAKIQKIKAKACEKEVQRVRCIPGKSSLKFTSVIDAGVESILNNGAA